MPRCLPPQVQKLREELMPEREAAEAAGGGLLEVRACNRSHPACNPTPLRLQP